MPDIREVNLRSELVALRQFYARTRRLPLYYVWSSASIEDIVRKKPVSLQQLMNVDGFGETRANNYGERIIQLVLHYFPERLNVTDEDANIFDCIEGADAVLDDNDDIILWNFNLIESKVREIAEDYQNNYAYGELSGVKRDLRELNRIKKRLEEKRELINARVLEPYLGVSAQIDTLLDIIKVPIVQLKTYVDSSTALNKEEKQQKIIDYFYSNATRLGYLKEWIVKSPKFFNHRWLNITYATEDWQRDVREIISNAITCVSRINSIESIYRAPALEKYIETLDIEAVSDYIERLKTLDREYDAAMNDSNQVYEFSLTILCNSWKVDKITTFLDALGCTVYDDVLEFEMESMGEDGSWAQ